MVGMMFQMPSWVVKNTFLEFTDFDDSSNANLRRSKSEPALRGFRSGISVDDDDDAESAVCIGVRSLTERSPPGRLNAQRKSAFSSLSFGKMNAQQGFSAYLPLASTSESSEEEEEDTIIDASDKKLEIGLSRWCTPASKTNRQICRQTSRGLESDVSTCSPWTERNETSPSSDFGGFGIITPPGATARTKSEFQTVNGEETIADSKVRISLEEYLRCPSDVSTQCSADATSCEVAKVSSQKSVEPLSEVPSVTSDGRTTIVLRRLPKNYTRDMVIQLLDRAGFWGKYDLVYLPIDFATETSMSYAFVNFVDPDQVAKFWCAFEGFSDWQVSWNKTCRVTWSEPHQGRDALIERYRDSPVMHQSVPDRFRPQLFENGVAQNFPAPHKSPKAPRARNHGGGNTPSRTKAKRGRH